MIPRRGDIPWRHPLVAALSAIVTVLLCTPFLFPSLPGHRQTPLEPAEVKVMRVLPEVNAGDSAADALRSIATELELELVIDPRCADQLNHPVGVHLRAVKARQVIDTLLRAVPWETPGLEWRAEGNRLIVAPYSPTPTVLRMYDVRDLIDEEVAHRERTKHRPEPADVARWAWGSGLKEPQWREMAEYDLSMQVHPWAWSSNEELAAAWGGRLVVQTTRKGHREIEDLLHLLRRTAPNLEGRSSVRR